MNRLAGTSVAMLMLLGVLCDGVLRATPILAQQGAPVAQSTNIRIFDPSGQPLRKTSISIDLKGQNIALGSAGIRTDESGGVTFPDIKFGNYSIYVQVEDMGYAYVNNANVQPAGARPINMRLHQGETLRVHAKEVVALAGRKKQTAEYPVGGALVMLKLLNEEQPAAVDVDVDTSADTRAPGRVRMTPGSATGVVQLQRKSFLIPKQTSTHDGTGIAVVSNIPPGRYAVTVTALSEYIPVVQEVEVIEGQPAELSVYLERGSVSGLHIALQDQNGKPLRHQNVSLVLKPTSEAGASAVSFYDFMRPRLARTDAKGNIFLYPLKVGRYTISSGNSGNEVLLPADTQVEVTPEGSQITLVAQPPPTDD